MSISRVIDSPVDQAPTFAEKYSSCPQKVGRAGKARVLCLLPILLSLILGCGPKKDSDLPTHGKALPKDAEERAKKESAEGDESTTEDKADLGPRLPWAKQTFSPRPGSSPDPRMESAEEACGAGDASLHEVAALLAQMHGESGQSATLDETNFHLRRRGAPYVMPRLWSAEMSDVDEPQLAQMVRDWAHSRPALGEYRCGVGLFQKDDGSYAATVLQVDVLADVQAIATTTSSGKWLQLKAQLLVDGSDASVLLLPPSGLPKNLRTELNGNRVSARLPIETEGTWLVQLMATVSGGPRPVAQMLVTADVEPPSHPDEKPVPGEETFDPKLRDADALFAIMNSARADQGLPELARNRELDQVAQEHCRAMMAQGRISHDTGAGDPAYRVERTGMSPKATGENVALAGSVVRLHRALWASPSHRENMLLRRWDEAGIAVIERKEDGMLFATELFIDSN